MSKVIKRPILVLICLFLVFSLFEQRKYYEFTCKNDTSMKNIFNSTQINQLSKKDSIMRISVGNVIFLKTQHLGFRIFAKQNFRQVRINQLEILYDNKHRILKKHNVYKPDDSNKNRVIFKNYEVDGINYSGVEKLIFSDFNTKNFCWVNFYNMFKWRHGKLNDKFPVKIVCHYSLDEENYTEEIDYIVECKEAYPSRLYKIFFNHLTQQSKKLKLRSFQKNCGLPTVQIYRQGDGYGGALVLGTWDLNAQNKSGSPNSLSGIGVGGAVWWSATGVWKIHEGKK